MSTSLNWKFSANFSSCEVFYDRLYLTMKNDATTYSISTSLTQGLFTGLFVVVISIVVLLVDHLGNGA